MYSKPAMTCFKYQLYLYGSEAIIYLKAILWVVTKPALYVIRLPQPPLQAALPPHPPLYGSITITRLEENSCMARLTYMEPSHVKQLSLNHLCKIGLGTIWAIECTYCTATVPKFLLVLLCFLKHIIQTSFAKCQGGVLILSNTNTIYILSQKVYIYSCTVI